jgi:RNA polymerase sigma-70 factor (ECF subfamily)
MAANAEQVTAAREALAALPSEQRATLELAYYEGLTQSEIAQRTATPIGTVKTRIRSGLQRLRDVVAPNRREA